MTSLTEPMGRALAGDFRAPAPPEDALAVHALRTAFDGTPFVAVDAVLQDSVSSDSHKAIAMGTQALVSFVRFDRPGLTAWVCGLERLTAIAGSEVVSLAHEIATGWVRIYDGQSPETELEALTDTARKAKLPSAVLEATTQHALARLSEGDGDMATNLARRASRMARAEEDLLREYLAAIVLARTRRSMGMPYLSLRILRAVARVTDGPFRHWTDWESVLSGGSQEMSGFGNVLSLARAGQRPDFELATKRLSIEGWPVFAQKDARTLLSAMQPQAGTSITDDDVQRWRTGETDAVPPALHGHNAQGAVRSSSGVVIVCRPDESGLRLLRIAAPLLRLEELGGGGVSPRVRLLLAHLALAGPAGIEATALFLKAYGFRYSKAQHDGVFRTGLSRARSAASGFADIQTGERIVMRVLKPFFLPDPSSVPSLSERILQRVGTTGDISSGEVAKDLQVPKRTVQRALSQLVDVGACRKTQSGKEVAYEVEDTTYGEPSLTRLKPLL